MFARSSGVFTRARATSRTAVFTAHPTHRARAQVTRPLPLPVHLSLASRIQNRTRLRRLTDSAHDVQQARRESGAVGLSRAFAKSTTRRVPPRPSTAWTTASLAPVCPLVRSHGRAACRQAARARSGGLFLCAAIRAHTPRTARLRCLGERVRVHAPVSSVLPPAARSNWALAPWDATRQRRRRMRSLRALGTARKARVAGARRARRGPNCSA